MVLFRDEEMKGSKGIQPLNLSAVCTKSWEELQLSPSSSWNSTLEEKRIGGFALLKDLSHTHGSDHQDSRNS